MIRKIWQIVLERVIQLLGVNLLLVMSLSSFSKHRMDDIHQIRVSINFREGESVESACKRLSEISGVPFSYNHNELRRVEVKKGKFQNELLPTILTALLAPTPFQYKIEEVGVLVFKPSVEAAIPTQIESSNPSTKIAIKGCVSDTFGLLSGVLISNKKRLTSTITLSDGSYMINANNGEVLVFSMVGYLSQEIKVSTQTVINVVLTPAVSTLDEVVVIGYGQQRKSSVTGAISNVPPQMLMNRPGASFSSTLQGVVAGLTVLSRPSDVGGEAANISITIRGRGNLGASPPFCVIDGIPVSTSDFTAINPNDIESISVLKDASSAAIYGNQAAHGVILVTTRKGKEGKTVISLNTSFGLQNPTVLPQYLGSVDYAILLNEAYANAGKAPRYSEQEIELFRRGSDPNLYPNTNWYDLTLRKNAAIKEYQLSLSGGGKTTYYIGMNVLQQQSLKVSKDFSRYNLRINTDAEVNPRIRVGTKSSLTYEYLNNEGGDFSFISLNRMAPSMVAKHYLADGTWLWGTVNGGKVDATLAKSNPIRLQNEGGMNFRKDYRILTSLNASYKVLKGLTLNGLASLNYFQDKVGDFQSEIRPLINYFTRDEIPRSGNSPNKYTEEWMQQNRISLQSYADYERNVGPHYGKIMAGISYETSRSEVIGANRQDFVNNNIHIIDGGTKPIDALGSRGFASERAQLSYFGRFNYSLSDKYLFEANLRIDGSSIFHPKNRWGAFPSLSAGWRISKEHFMKDLDWIDDLKFRASWGKLGNIANNGPDDYPYFEKLNNGYAYNFDGKSFNGVWAGKGVNILTTWEKATTTDFGLEMTLLKNKLYLIADYYTKNTTDILMEQKTLPATYYRVSPYINAGAVRNSGVEFGLTYANSIDKLKYNVGFNLSKIKNQVTNLNGDFQQITDRFIDRIGCSIGSFFGYKSDGLFVTDDEVMQHAFQTASTSAGDIKYVDQNGDKVINAEDRVVIGNDVPYFTYGINLEVNYKGFDLALTGQGTHDVKIYLDSETAIAFFNGGGVKRLHYKRWTSENPDANAPYPRLLSSVDNSKTMNVQASDFWLFNAGYFRFKSVVFGYSLPKHILEKSVVSSARFYISAQNPFTLMYDDRLNDYDPEAPSGRGNYPATKTLAFGLNVQF